MRPLADIYREVWGREESPANTSERWEQFRIKTGELQSSNLWRIYDNLQQYICFILRIWRTSPTPERILISQHPTPSRQISAWGPHFPLDVGLKFDTPPPAARGDNLVIREYNGYSLSVGYGGTSPCHQNTLLHIECQRTIGDSGVFTGQQ